MAKKDFYRLLNLDHTASLKQIKSAYRQLALKYHPDHNPNNMDAAQIFAAVREAYEILSNPDSKAQYDSTYQPQKKTSNEGPAVWETDNNKRSPQSSGKNLRYNLYITLEDVLNGCERTIRYIRNNKGEKETVQLKVRVPKGAFNNQRLKLSQYGDVEKNGSGDLFVIVHLQNHPMFLKKDLDLRVNIPIRYVDIMLGSTIEVPTLNGVRKLKLKSCDFDELQFTWKGFGLPDHKANLKGDLHIHCFIEHPKKLSSTQRDAMQKLSKTWPEGEMMQQYQVYLKQLKGN